MRSRARRALGVGLCSLAALFTAIGASATAAIASPARGGTVVIGSLTAQTLDPGALGYTPGQFGIDAAIYSTLFLPGSTKDPVLPGLATSYQYSKNLETLTINLRHGVSFQDGTPFNAQAVEWNLTRAGDLSTAASQNFVEVSSVTTKGKYQVIMHFKQPDALMIYVLSQTGATFMESPTAYASEGAVQFGITPVGAGPFKVQSDEPLQQLVLARWPGYWDARHVYLDELEYENVGTNQSVVLDDMESNEVQSYTILGVTAVPTVLQQAVSTPNIVETKGAKDLLLYLPMNTERAPFNNIQAREALEYCTDRTAIADSVEGGFSQPAPIYSGPGELYYPKGGPQAAMAKQPFPYDPSKGTQLVSSVGGMTFSVLAAAGQAVVIATALQQEWEACGMHVTVQPYTGNTQLALYESGSFQLAINQNGGYTNPGLVCSLLIPVAGTQSAYFYDSATMTKLCNATDYTTNPTALQGIWDRWYATAENLAVDIPLTSSENIYFDSKCLKGEFGILAGVDFNSAYYTCTP